MRAAVGVVNVPTRRTPTRLLATPRVSRAAQSVTGTAIQDMIQAQLLQMQQDREDRIQRREMMEQERQDRRQIMDAFLMAETAYAQSTARNNNNP